MSSLLLNVCSHVWHYYSTIYSNISTILQCKYQCYVSCHLLLLVKETGFTNHNKQPNKLSYMILLNNLTQPEVIDETTR